MPDDDDTNYLLYDGDCPFCARFVRFFRLRATIGPLRLIDARVGGPEDDEVRARGLDVNSGMVLKLNGHFHHGADCINVLAMLSTRSDAFNRCLYHAFRWRPMAQWLYPVLRVGRRLALFLLGRMPLGGPSAR